MTTPKQPTEAEINEALLKEFNHKMDFKDSITGPTVRQHNRQIEVQHESFKKGITWLQNYQAQQPVKQVRSLEQILKEHGVIEYDVRTNAAMHEYASQFQTPAIGISEGSQIESLEQAANDYNNDWRPSDRVDRAFKAGAKWQSSQPQPNAISVIEARITTLEASLPNYPTEQPKHAIKLRINTYKDCINILKGDRKR